MTGPKKFVVCPDAMNTIHFVADKSHTGDGWARSLHLYVCARTSLTERLQERRGERGESETVTVA